MKLHLHDISFAYDHDMILQNINCSFVSGNFYSIIGPNGSGKTTLLDLISGFFNPCKGSINIDETPLLSLSKKEIAKKVSLVSQDYIINFPFSVKDVVMMGRHPYIPRFSHPGGDDIKKVGKVMKACGIQHLSDRKINELSGGERQRCVFARALCQDTKVLLLDEAFSNMDINHTLQMLGLVKRSVKEKNTLVISVLHDLNLASSWSDELLMLKKGEIKASGHSQDVLTQHTIKDVFGVTSIVEFNEHAQAKQVYYPSI
ncbi:MAG: ABC transporter ATP-binding protein [Desulfobacula sp.]|uniref:ABC transporter ATP-binding protein n=1 Tax=Desulfobacula sp. TaxID=2593537 RepID=UPI001DEEF68B|nr:ABC transporter ATP-binding protein [Desulfobacula sp.]MBT3483922.1 ABC transporter ATP-binding protein [Desulfobacula sp.]MBT3803891.1 ABC transporter ATP-binding protein [Desulfobacula sp.]MBT4023836.1 ABC transporter ATP-binding protein [Desulfobacula sp.]MBT4197604.1 ABC transporter ATP-binding protein [Desulfobacula sp.]